MAERPAVNRGIFVQIKLGQLRLYSFDGTPIQMPFNIRSINELVAEWLIASDCRSEGETPRVFKSHPTH